MTDRELLAVDTAVIFRGQKHWVVLDRGGAIVLSPDVCPRARVMAFPNELTLVKESPETP